MIKEPMKQLKITKTHIREILDDLSQKSVFTLSLNDLCIYAIYRIEKLVTKEHIVHYDEIRYRLCEIGPGNRRFDSLVLAIILESDFFQRKAYTNIIREKNWFSDQKMDLIKNQLSLKTKVIEEIYHASISDQVLEKLKKACAIIFKECGYKQIEYLKITNKNYLEFKINHSSNTKNNLLLRFYNTPEWIYPDSWQIWDLFETAYKKKCIPVLIAPRIHGACFQLFKTLGMFARANYYIFTDKTMKEIKTIVLKKKKTSLPNLSLGKFEPLNADNFEKRFDNLKQLLTIIIPEHLDAFTLRQIASSKKIISSLNKDLLDSLVLETSKLNAIQRNQRIGKILSFKLGHLKNIRKMIKQNEIVIKKTAMYK